ncbi:MAG: transcriptional repressor [Alphaproteobacteria bacterium]|nr:transcriptional repressor [Alphaproteobacteria bacterium]
MDVTHVSETEPLGRLRKAGLRPTRQRLALARMLFSQGDRHVTAEQLRDEVAAEGARVSMATIYNTLHHFTRAGLLRHVVVDAGRTYFDTNTGHHHHFYVESEHRLIDIDGDTVRLASVPDAPPGRAIDSIDVIVRLKPDIRA